MARLGGRRGRARQETFAGLAGMGDLDRHLLVAGRPQPPRRRADRAGRRRPTRPSARSGWTVEGLTTAPVLRDLSHRLGIELPITDGVCAVLGGEPLHELVGNLMRRQPTTE